MRYLPCFSSAVRDYLFVEETLICFSYSYFKKIDKKFQHYIRERNLSAESVLYDRLELRMKLFPEIMEVCEYQEEGLFK